MARPWIVLMCYSLFRPETLVELGKVVVPAWPGPSPLPGPAQPLTHAHAGQISGTTGSIQKLQIWIIDS